MKVTAKEYICTQCRRTLNIVSHGVEYCTMCGAVMHIMDSDESLQKTEVTPKWTKNSTKS